MLIIFVIATFLEAILVCDAIYGRIRLQKTPELRNNRIFRKFQLMSNISIFVLLVVMITSGIAMFL